MTKTKKLSIFIFSLMLVLASFLFVACNKNDYSKTTLSASSSHIELFKGEASAQQLSVTIQNPVGNMSNKLLVTNSNTYVCSIEEIVCVDYTTTYTITGINGGDASLSFISEEGGRQLDVSVKVREYADKISEESHSLYVSSSTKFIPSSQDFDFGKNTVTERELEYYFYGKTVNKGLLEKEILEDTIVKANGFVSVSLVPVGSQEYLVFEDATGRIFTLGKGETVAGNGDEKYGFLPIILENDSYIIDLANATAVTAGDKFTFVAKYKGENDENIIFCEREFYVLIDIIQSNFSHEFGYKIEGRDYIPGDALTAYKIEGIKNGKITLIPDYKSVIVDQPMLYDKKAIFATSYLEVLANFSNDLLKVKFATEDSSVATSVKLKETADGTNKTYYIELNCATLTATTTNYNVTFYYEGFENSTDSNVNFTYSIPVEIRIIPTNLLVNNASGGNGDNVYTFYNYYASSIVGWQPFNFAVIPNDAEFDTLAIDLEGSNLQVRYRNVVYTSGIVNIDNINEPVYFKGVDGVPVSAGVKELPVSLLFNVIQADSMNAYIKYEIVKGAEVLDFKSDDLEKNIYIDVDAGKQAFSDLYADAPFNSMTFTHVSGTDDVVRFEYDKNSPYTTYGHDFLLNFDIIPTSCGNGSYTVMLDNGKMMTINISVLEALKEVSVESTNEDNCITLIEEVVQAGDKSTIIYALNIENKSYFDLHVFANSNKNSTAIKTVNSTLNTNFVEVGNASANNQYFNVYILQNGSSQLLLTAEGYSVEDFRRVDENIEYVVDIVSYSLIEKMNVYKKSDGLGNYADQTIASYANVYSNTANETLRGASLDVTVRNQNGFLFENPYNKEFVAESYDSKFVFWESDTAVYKNGVEILDRRMYYKEGDLNVYTIGSYGTFDTEKMKFTAFANLQTAGSLRIISHIRQYKNLYSYTINIKISIYEEVERVTLQNMVTELEFSAIDRVHYLVAQPINDTATNGEIVALFNGGIIRDGGDVYSILDKDSISYVESDGKTQIKLTLSEEFLEQSVGRTEKMQGDLVIVAKDWLDIAGNLNSSYQDLALHVTVNFANGTEKNRFTITDASDLLAVRDNLSAHYKIKTTIDVSPIVSQLPLGVLYGSIVGVNEHALITGLNITSNTTGDYTNVDGTCSFGLFNTIEDGAYIEYVQFNGSFNIGSVANSFEQFSNIGLVAGVNKGELINVGATISTSNIYFNQGNFGGLVGVNEGNIIQDFTLFEDEFEDAEVKKYNHARTKLASELAEQGRIYYRNLMPKVTVFMNGYVNINYVVINDPNAIVRMGGVVGLNKGNIQKIDSKNLTFTGYSNYMAYTLIKSVPSNLNLLTNISRSYVGGLVGENIVTVDATVTVGGKIYAGYNEVVDENVRFSYYDQYRQEIVNGTNVDIEGNFVAGNGIVVGGDVWGYGYVAGVIGRNQNINTYSDFTGITARTFIRGQKAGETVANIALIANIESMSGGASLSTAFTIQAVDDGRTSEEASMAILYNGDAVNEYKTNINKLGFGNFVANNIDILKGFDGAVGETYSPINVFTYVISRVREQIPAGAGNYLYVENIPKTAYYGDFIVVGIFEGRKTVIDQVFFTKGDAENLSLSPKFNNKMFGGSLNREIYYTYYYQVASSPIDDLTAVQSWVDTYLNRLTLSNEFYPFVTNGEMLFTSRNSDILTIDQMGKITVKRTGLAQVSATSVLNSNDALNFYIYVVNYFNSEYDKVDNESKSSIVYPNLSASATAVDKTTIVLRGENSATLYIKPNYFSEQIISNGIETVEFESDKFGDSILGTVAFSLAGNEEVSASVVETDGDENLEIEVVGQVITIRKLADTEENIYNLTIVPQLQLVLEDDAVKELYYANVNKVISESSVDYKYGALSIANVNYNEVPISTSNAIMDVITICSTDKNENPPKYQILGFDDLPLQGNVAGQNYALTNASQQLFTVSFASGGEKKDLGLGRFEHYFTMVVKVNTKSPMYLNRYNQNIYGRYKMYVQADSNAGKNILIQIDFEQTNVFSMVVDNYSSLNDATTENGLGTTSPYAFPGESGLLAITITPEDSDFDYILIENDDRNYQTGYSSALLGLLARKDATHGGSDMFEDGIISGSIIKKGLKLYLDDVVKFYSNDDYVDYNGVIYIKYNLTSNNVVDGSVSKLNIKLFKDGKIVNNGETVAELSIKLKNYVAVEIEGKEGDSTSSTYYKMYTVARGLRYKLKVNSYGFRLDNASITIDKTSLASIVEENGQYYLDITSSAINYADDENKFEILISVSQNDGDLVRTASSKTHVTVYEYVVNYNGEIIENADILSEMGDGIINVQVGTQTTFAVDLYDYIEYDETNNEVVNKINSFLSAMSRSGTWIAYTNLTNNQPNFEMATGKNGDEYSIGYASGNEIVGGNYYFNYNGLNVIPVRTHLPEEKYYFFTYTGYFKAENGIYTIDESNLSEANKVATTFVLNVFSASSEESPIPVYDYDDLNDMQRGGYYILLNDIIIPNEIGEDGVSVFKPINANFASFDGNGHTISMCGTYNMGRLENIGLFSQIAEGTVVKNLNLNFTSASDGSDINADASDTTYALQGLRTVKFVTSAESFIFGAIASENLGIITNCKVTTENVLGNEYYLSIRADNALTGLSYMGGLVGINSGFITNCGVSINVKAPFNIAGVVAQNFNKISGCYFSKGKLINNSQFDQHVAGFAISNSRDSQIMSSYVAGAPSNSSLINRDENSFITSTLAGAGFIYENSGNVQDCYTDINLSKTTSEMAGFVYRNGGVVKNSFSLSVLRNNVTASAGFVKENVHEGMKGTLSNCYYFYNKQNGATVDGFDLSLGDINTSLYNEDHDGVTALNTGEFNNIEKYFADYSYQETMGTDAIWFYSKGNTSNIFVDYIPTLEKIVVESDKKEEEDKEDKVQTNTIYKTEVMTFGKNRLELVNPNIRVLSTRNFSYSETDNVTGNVTYHYIDDANSPNRGSLHNPRLISSAETMESEIQAQTSSTKICTASYRIISDIEYEGQSNLYKVTFAGNLEGNGMEISRISLVSMDKLESGGLFAQVGYSASKKGTVKNLTINPREVSFNNAISVGTLAGVLKYGEVYNVTVTAVQGTSETITGRNFVGGIIGRAISSYKMQDVYSFADVSANFSPAGAYSYSEILKNEESCSYAGSIVGFAGKGTIYNAQVKQVSSIMGGNAGFAYGGVGTGANVKYTFVDVRPNSSIKAYHYGGYIAGEVSGTLTYAHVSNNKNTESSFAIVPKVPIAVGGIAGRLNGGHVSNAVMEQNFRVTNTLESNSVKIVGGLVGVVDASTIISTITDSKVTGQITSTFILGGGIGQVSSPLVLSGISITSEKLVVVGESSNPALGGIIGKVSEKDGSSVEMNFSYCTSDLEVTTNTSGVQSVARVGGLIGSSTKKPKLSYCYTTSKIEAEVYDSRQVGETCDFTVSNKGEAIFTNAVNGSYDSPTDDYQNVYYLGSETASSIYGNSEDKTVYTDMKSANFVSFKTKTKNTVIGLTVNNYGISSMAYSEELFADVELGKSKVSLYNLFGNTYNVESNDVLYEMVYNSNANEYVMQNSTNANVLGILKNANFVEDENHYGKYIFTTGALETAFEDYFFNGENKDYKAFKVEYLYQNGDDTETFSYCNDLNGKYFKKDADEDVQYKWDETSSTYVFGETELKLSKLSMKVTVDSSKLIQTKILKDSAGDYYLKGLARDGEGVKESYTNISTGEVFYALGGGEFAATDGDKLAEIPTIEVWKTSISQLSALAFEEKFDWLNKL